MLLAAARPRRIAVLVAAVALVWAVASVPAGVHSALVRLAFVVLWLSVPWVVTRSLRHLAARVGAAPPVVAMVTGASWVLSAGALAALTAAFAGSGAVALWGTGAAVAAAAVLVLVERTIGPDLARDEDDPDAWLQGPFLD